MKVNNGSVLLEEQQETPTGKKTMSRLLEIIHKPKSTEAHEVSATSSTPQQIKVKLSACLDYIRGWFGHYKQLTHYFALLCFLLVIITLFQTLCLVQITFVFQSQSSLQETKVRDLTSRLEKLNQSYRLLFSQYPALDQYCSVSNYTTGERVCGPCPANWTAQGEKCFLFMQDRADWISSQYHCMALGGAVATVRTEEEQVFLWKKAQSLSQGDSYWLGLRGGGGGGGAGGWQWGDGSPVEKGPEFWQRTPDNPDSRDLCGRLTPGDNYRTSWFTSRCSNQLRSICERRQASLQ